MRVRQSRIHVGVVELWQVVKRGVVMIGGMVVLLMILPVCLHTQYSRTYHDGSWKLSITMQHIL